MATNKLILKNWSSEQISKLLYSTPERKASLRLFASYLVSKGYSARELSKLFNVSFKQITLWIHDFDELGEQGLIDKPKTGRTPKLTPDDKLRIKEIMLYTEPVEFKIEGERWSAKNLEELIAKEFGVQYKKAQIYNIIKSLEIEYKNNNWREISEKK